MIRRMIAVALCIGLCACSSLSRGTADDGAILDEVRASLRLDGFQAIGVKVDHGVVTLTGHLPSNTFREKAVGDAELPDGVKRVIDDIEVP